MRSRERDRKHDQLVTLVVWRSVVTCAFGASVPRADDGARMLRGMSWFRSLVASVALLTSWAGANIPLDQLEQLRSHTLARSVACSDGLAWWGAVACWTYPVSLEFLGRDLQGAASRYPNVEALGGSVSPETRRYQSVLEIDGVRLLVFGADGFVIVFVAP